MSLVSVSEILLKAQKQGYAVGAFNVENLEMIQAVVAAAEELCSPVIIQTTPSTLKYASPRQIAAIVRSLTDSSKLPIALHLDHGDSFELAAQAMQAGYSSVMIDGSKLPLEENIALTKSVVAFCRPCGVSVEGELGAIGGKEDGVEGEIKYTEPEEAAVFAYQTEVDALAVAIGTAHGIYKSTPILNIERLKQIKATTNVPLVLHGTSGVDGEVVKECISNGICKVNYATDLRIAFSDGIKEYLNAHPDVFDPKKYNSHARQKVKERAMEKILICGSAHKA